jgi:hypothetical protein
MSRLEYEVDDNTYVALRTNAVGHRISGVPQGIGRPLHTEDLFDYIFLFPLFPGLLRLLFRLSTRDSLNIVLFVNLVQKDHFNYPFFPEIHVINAIRCWIGVDLAIQYEWQVDLLG